MLDLRKRGLQIDGCLNLGQSGMQFAQQANPYSKYAFYVDFADGIGKDRVSKTAMVTTLETGRVNADGTALGEDVPAIQDGKLNTLGQIKLLNGKTDDITNNITWEKTVSGYGENYIQPSAQYQLLRNVISTNSTKKYTISFYAYVEEGTHTNGAFYHYGSADSQYTKINITTERQRFSVTIAGSATNSIIQFGYAEYESNNFKKIYIDTINITESNYLLPPVHNDTTGPVTIPHGYSDANEGYKWPIVSCPKLLDALDGVADGEDLIVSFINRIAPNGYETFTTTANSMQCINTVGYGIGGFNISGTVGDYVEINFTISDFTGPAIISLGERGNINLGPMPILNDLSDGTYSVRYTLLNTNPAISIYTDEANCSFLASNISAKQISPAQGTMIVEWEPQFSTEDITESVWKSIFTVEGGSTIDPFRFASNGNDTSLVLDDGPNVVSKTVKIVAGTLYTITIKYGDSLMSFTATDGETTWTSNTVSFVGTFSPSGNFIFAYGDEYWQQFKSIKILEGNPWD